MFQSVGSPATPMQAESVGVEALLSGLLNRKLPGPGTSIAAQNLRFEGSVEAGDEVVASATAREKSPEGRLIVFDCAVRCKGRNLVTGTVTVRAPERRLRYSDVATPEVMLRRADNFARLLKRCEGSQPVADPKYGLPISSRSPWPHPMSNQFRFRVSIPSLL